MRRTAPALLLAAMIGPTFAWAADIDVKPPDKPAPTNASIFVPPEPTCIEWTDGCRVCQKPAAGDAVCSNAGIACTPQAAKCTKRP